MWPVAPMTMIRMVDWVGAGAWTLAEKSREATLSAPSTPPRSMV
jgi:hypothetical protein